MSQWQLKDIDKHRQFVDVFRKLDINFEDAIREAILKDPDADKWTIGAHCVSATFKREELIEVEDFKIDTVNQTPTRVPAKHKGKIFLLARPDGSTCFISGKQLNIHLEAQPNARAFFIEESKVFGALRNVHDSLIFCKRVDDRIHNVKPVIGIIETPATAEPKRDFRVAVPRAVLNGVIDLPEGSERPSKQSTAPTLELVPRESRKSQSSLTALDLIAEFEAFQNGTAKDKKIYVAEFTFLRIDRCKRGCRAFWRYARKNKAGEHFLTPLGDWPETTIDEARAKAKVLDAQWAKKGMKNETWN